MEEQLDTEESRRIEALKAFALRYRYTLVAVAVLVIAAAAGAWGWLEYRQARLAEASDAYRGAVQALDGDEPEKARQALTTLIQDSGGTPYATFARVLKARLLNKRGSPAKATDLLEPLTRSGTRPEVARHIAVEEMARIRWQTEGAKAGLQALKRLEGEAYLPSHFQLKGDLLAEMGRTEAAKAAYDRAAGSPGARYLQPGLGWRRDRTGSEGSGS